MVSRAQRGRSVQPALSGRGRLDYSTFAIGVSLLQVGALMAAGWLRGSHFHATASGVAWFTGAVLAFTVFMYGLAEILANRIPT